MKPIPTMYKPKKQNRGGMILFVIIAIILLAIIYVLRDDSLEVEDYSNLASSSPQNAVLDEPGHFRDVHAIVLAYSSTVDQTDDDPFITASGEKVRDGIVANNCYAFGTMLIIDFKVYTVLDRMNERYGCEYFDIWMETRQEALDWGVKYIQVSVWHGGK